MAEMGEHSRVHHLGIWLATQADSWRRRAMSTGNGHGVDREEMVSPVQQYQDCWHTGI